MTRRFGQHFHCEALAELARQLHFAPPEKRAQQVRRAERLHDQIDPARNYPLDFLMYRITGYRSESADPTVLVGQAIQPDLRLLIDRVSRSIKLPITADDPVESVEDLAQRLAVSTKTITRWRKLGLRWRWVMFPGQSQPRVGFPRAAVEGFLKTHADRVQRAAKFTHLSDEDRQALIDRARRIAQASQVSLNRVAQHLARRTGRAPETLRHLLEQHDREHPDDPIFVDRTGPLTAWQKRVIVRAHRRGVPVSRMARRLRRTRATIYRALQQRRTADLRLRTIRFAALPVFERDDADQVLLRPQGPEMSPAGDDWPRMAAAPAGDLPAPLQPLYEHPPMSESQQRTLLVRMNYLRFKAARQRDRLDRYNPRAGDLDHIDLWLQQAQQIRRQVVQASLPLVLSVARRHLIGESDPSMERLVELLEMANPVLLDAIDTFDLSREQSFDAYLTWLLMRHFASQEDASPAGAADAAARRRAHRRESPEDMARRMQEKAAEFRAALELPAGS